ncbi:MAG: hypothetical protein HQL31_00175 [Planctomycetes bacterium]|nr:hypothetical protein [Planctomycetota bacterium]
MSPIHRSEVPLRASLSLFYLSALLMISYGLLPLVAGSLDAVRSYGVYYGPLDGVRAQDLEALDMVVLHPGPKAENLSHKRVAELRRGPDGKLQTVDDIIVMAYVSIGEDDDVQGGPRQLTPLMRGPSWRTADGAVHFAERGFSNWLMDEVALQRDENGQWIWGEDGLPLADKGRDGLPDENGKWHSYYVNVADADWQKRIRRRMDLLLKAYGCDGLFLDTVDTASPWGHYGWMQEDMVTLVERIRGWFPNTKIMMNRGLFLFEKHTDRLKSVLDGVMFESFVSEWDWYRSVGTRHRWYAANLDLLNGPLGNANTGKDGIPIFFLNYLSPTQTDIPLFVHALRSATSKFKGAHAIASPDLMGLPRALNWPLWQEGENRPLVFSGNATARHLGLKSWSNHPGFSPSRLCLNLHKTGQSPDSPFLPLAPDMFNPANGELLLPELEPGHWQMDLALVDPSGVPLLKGSLELTEIERGLLPSVDRVEALVRDGGLDFSWGPVPEADSYELEWGEAPFSRSKLRRTGRPGLELRGLKNGKTVFFTVRALKGGERGYSSDIYHATPCDCTPPLPPKLVKVTLSGLEVIVSWNPSSSPDASGTYVYLDPPGLGRGLPVKIQAGQRNCRLQVPVAGLFELRLSAFDANNNESECTEPRLLEFASPPTQ